MGLFYSEVMDLVEIEIEFFTICGDVLDRLDVVLRKIESLKVGEPHCA